MLHDKERAFRQPAHLMKEGAMRLWHWLIGKKKEAKMTEEHRDATLEQRLVSLERFWFLADAPMFIDGEMVERLHDAIFRPEVELASRSEAATGELAGKVASTTDIDRKIITGSEDSQAHWIHSALRDIRPQEQKIRGLRPGRQF